MDLKVEEYKKSVLVKGNSTHEYREVLRGMGGSWNATLRAWVFGGKKKNMLEKWLQNLKDKKSVINVKPKAKTISKKYVSISKKSTKKHESKKKHSLKEFISSESIVKDIGSRPILPKEIFSQKVYPKEIGSRPVQLQPVQPSVLKIDMKEVCAVPPKAGPPLGYPITLSNACTFYLNFPIDPNTTRRNWEHVLKLARQKIPNDLVRVKNGKSVPIDAADLSYLFEVFDNTYFAGSLWKRICDDHGVLKFQFSSRKATHKAGVCKRRGSDYEIILYASIFNDLFLDESHKSYISNGMPCHSRLECLLNVFAHELCHLILLHFCKRDPLIQSEKSHGPTFQRFVRHLFGHTEFRHALSNQNVNSKSTSDTKSIVEALYRKNKDHTFKINLGGKGDIVDGKIVRLNPKRAKVYIPSTQKTWGVGYISFVV